MSYPQFGYTYSSPASSLASTQLLMTAATASPPVAPPTTVSTSCCENGRPIMTDPHTGQTICSCQYSPSLLSTYPRVPGLPDSVYSSAYAAQGYVPFGADPSAFYSPLNPNNSGMAYPYDPTSMGYPYGTTYGGMDLNSAAHRKNATREATSTLKAWLYEHRKNPYPTKGEKIMLAIITKMTLTQVSTWFANARRRLKKENKMTWSPRNRCGDDEDGEKLDSEGEDETNENGRQRNENGDDKKDADDDINIDTDNDINPGEDSLLSKSGIHRKEVDIDKRNGCLSPDLGSIPSPSSSVSPGLPHLSPAAMGTTSLTVKSSIGGGAPGLSPGAGNTITQKPRIWSLADVATSTTTSSERRPTPPHSSIEGLPMHVHSKPPPLPHPGVGATVSYPSAMNNLKQWVDGAYSMSMSSRLASHPYALAAPQPVNSHSSVGTSTPSSYTSSLSAMNGTAAMSAMQSSASAGLSTMSKFSVNSLTSGMSGLPGYPDARDLMKLHSGLIGRAGDSIVRDLSSIQSDLCKSAVDCQEQKTAFKPVPKRAPLL